MMETKLSPQGMVMPASQTMLPAEQTPAVQNPRLCFCSPFLENLKASISPWKAYLEPLLFAVSPNMAVLIKVPYLHFATACFLDWCQGTGGQAWSAGTPGASRIELLP